MNKISLWISAACLGLSVFICFYSQTRPESTIRVKISRPEALRRSDQVISQLGYQPKKYQRTIIFNDCDPLYLKKTFGMNKTRELIESGEVPCNEWEIRYFQENNSESLYTRIDTVTGELIYYGRSLAENDKGDQLTSAEAREIAERYFDIAGERLNKYTQVDSTSEQLPQRTDYTFQWEKQDYKIGEAKLRVFINIQGSKLGAYNLYLKIPEAFHRNFQKEQMPARVVLFGFAVLTVLINIAVIVFLFIQYKYGTMRWKAVWLCAVWFFVTYFLVIANNFNGALSSYNPWMSQANFLGFQILQDLFNFGWEAAGLFLVLVTGDSIARSLNKDPFPVLGYLFAKNGNWEDIKERLFIGYSLGLIYAGYVTVFYLVSSHFTQVWKPMSGAYAHAFRAYIPAFDTFMNYADVTRDCVFYFLFIPFAALKIFKNERVAILLAALFFTFKGIGPTIWPMEIRIVELIIFGCIWGWAALRYGLETVILGKTTFVVLLMAIPLILSTVPYFQINGVAAIGILFLPVLFLRPFRPRNSI